MSYLDDVHEPAEPDPRTELQAIRAELVALLERVERALLAGPPPPQQTAPLRMTGAARGRA